MGRSLISRDGKIAAKMQKDGNLGKLEQFFFSFVSSFEANPSYIFANSHQTCCDWNPIVAIMDKAG